MNGRVGRGCFACRINATVIGSKGAKEGEEVTVALAGDVKGGKVYWTKVEKGRGGEKDGMYEWVCGIPAGKKVKLEAEWDVKAPSSMRWEETANLFR